MKTVRLSAILLLFALAVPASRSTAQSITLGSIPKSLFCAGEEFQLTYSAGGFSSTKNSFVVQLSDPQGTFSTFQSIGFLRTTSSGTITATIPTSVVTSNKYRLRLISTDPYVVSSSISGEITLGGVPYPRMQYSYRELYAMVGDSLTFISTSVNASSLQWDFGADAMPTGSTEDTVTVSYSTPGVKHIRLTAISAGGCEVTRLLTGEDIFVYVGTCNPKIPADVKIDSFGNRFGHGQERGPFWIVPGGTYDEYGGRYQEFFVEPGGTVNQLGSNGVVYLKAGSSLVGGTHGMFIIHESGASIDAASWYPQKFECPDLEFDYSDAPPYKIEQASVSGTGKVDVNVYPNPASDKLALSDGVGRVKHARLYNITGKLVATALWPNNSELLSVKDIPEGLYNLELQFEDGIQLQKILVRR